MATQKDLLSSFASEIVAKNKFVKASFGGFAGSGKTRTGAEFIVGSYKDLGCTKPILIIDNEKGSRFLIPFFKKELPKAKVLIKDTTSLADVIEAMRFLEAGEIDFLFIDSLSKVWYQYVRDYKKKNNVRFMQLQDWGKILPVWQEEYSDRYVDLNGSVVFTGRGGFTYDREEEEKDESGNVTKKAAFVKSGVKMKMAGETPFEPDLNIWMEQHQEIEVVKKKKKIKVWREAQVMKDRSGLIDGKTFVNPTYKDFKPVVTFLLDLPTGNVAGQSDSTNLAPSENWDGLNKKNNRAICLEEIKATFQALSLGASEDAKRIKVLILEKLFTTASWTKLETMDVAMLEPGVATLKVFKEKYLEQKPATFEQVSTLLTASLTNEFVFDNQ